MQCPIDSSLKERIVAIVMIRWKHRYRAIRISAYNFQNGKCNGWRCPTAGGLHERLAGWNVSQLSPVIHSVGVAEHKECVLVGEDWLKPVPSVGQQALSAKEFAELFWPAISREFIAEFAESRSLASSQDYSPFMVPLA